MIQILLLFLGAAVVSAAVIFLLRIEAKNRYGDLEDSSASDRAETTIGRSLSGISGRRTTLTPLPTDQVEDPSAWSKVRAIFREMTGSEGKGQRRRKRSADFESDQAPYFTVNEWVRKFGQKL